MTFIDGTDCKATVLGVDEDKDLAVLTVNVTSFSEEVSIRCLESGAALVDRAKTLAGWHL